MASIFLKNIKKSFRNTEIIKNISLDIQDGKCTVLVGPSGCGKSTLLRIICGLEEVDSGEIFIGKEKVTELPPSHRGLAMVFQSYALYPHMTTFENMAFALKIRKFTKEQIRERVLNAAKILKIESLLNRRPKELSGGQRQRVAIGRCIVRNPHAFLFDEPLSNLDASLRHEMRYEIAKLKDELKTTMVYVTHDQEEAMTLADKIVVMKDGQIEQVGTPLEVYKNPTNTFVASFIGSPTMNLIYSQMINQDTKISFKISETEDINFENVYKDIPKGENYIIGVRPKDIEIVQEQSCNILTAQVTMIEDLGGFGYIHARLSSGQIINIQSATISQKIGEKIYINIKPGQEYLFFENGNRVEKK